MNVPNVPFLPVPLPQQLSFPADLAALMPSGLLPGGQACCGARGARRGSGCRLRPLRLPRSAAAAAAPAPGAGLAPLVMPLSALP